MKQVWFNSLQKFRMGLLVCAGLACSVSAVQSQVPGALPLDNFNRSNNVVLGAASGGGITRWVETETSGSNNFRARVENTMLVLSSYNTASSGGSSGTEQVAFNLKNRFATIYNQASGNLVWAFNFRQSRTSPSGFGTGFYGVAFVLGSTDSVFTSSNASGYAVVIGNANSPDPVRLVRFTNGLSANSNLTTLLTTSEEAVTAYYSAKVTFNPCSKEWSLQVRNDGTAFGDPATVSSTPLVIKDQSFTNSNLGYVGAAFSHGTANEKAFFDNLYVPQAPASGPVTYTWTGVVSSSFDDPGNWFPNRNCSILTDILTFNAGFSGNITNVGGSEIGKLIVPKNAALTLRAKAGATQTLAIMGGEGEDLVVEAGASLIIDSNDPIEISMKPGTTGRIQGSVIFQNTAANLGRAHRLLIADANAVQFEAGSKFIAQNLAGEPFGNSGTANVINFKANSGYISRDGASPFGLATPNSKVIFETGSLYRHEQIGTAPKFDGRAYADFELNVTNALAIIFGTSAPTPTRIDNFTISSGTMNVTLASGSTPLPLQIKKNLTIAPGATFNFNPASGANTSLIQLNGTEKQQISGSINLGQFANLEINNPSGVDLLSTLSVKGNLQFTQGNLNLMPPATLGLEDNATVSGAWNGSYVNGRVFKTGDDAFTFPTGKAGFYAPIGISAPKIITDKFSAEYFPENPVALFGSAKNDSLALISNSEYWDLERVSGTSDVKVTLSYDAGRSIAVTNPEALRIAHFKGNEGWSNEGRAEILNQSQFSLLSTRQSQSSFSPFTFAAIGGNAPLPVTLVSFSARTSGSVNVLNWETATEKDADRFEIERSYNGRTFEKIGSVKAAGTSSQAKQYGFEDKNPEGALQYYRLKQLDIDGTTTFSKVVTVNRNQVENNFLLYPNPATELITVRKDFATSVSIHIFDLSGKELIKYENLHGTEVKLDISRLPIGTYQMVLGADGVRTTTKFMKIAR